MFSGFRMNILDKEIGWFLLGNLELDGQLHEVVPWFPSSKNLDLKAERKRDLVKQPFPRSNTFGCPCEQCTKNLVVLGYIGDSTTQFYWDDDKPL